MRVTGEFRLMENVHSSYGHPRAAAVPPRTVRRKGGERWARDLVARIYLFSRERFFVRSIGNAIGFRVGSRVRPFRRLGIVVAGMSCIVACVCGVAHARELDVPFRAIVPNSWTLLPRAPE